MKVLAQLYNVDNSFSHEDVDLLKWKLSIEHVNEGDNNILAACVNTAEQDVEQLEISGAFEHRAVEIFTVGETSKVLLSSEYEPDEMILKEAREAILGEKAHIGILNTSNTKIDPRDKENMFGALCAIDGVHRFENYIHLAFTVAEFPNETTNNPKLLPVLIDYNYLTGEVYANEATANRITPETLESIKTTIRILQATGIFDLVAKALENPLENDQEIQYYKSTLAAKGIHTSLVYREDASLVTCHLEMFLEAYTNFRAFLNIPNEMKLLDNVEVIEFIENKGDKQSEKQIYSEFYVSIPPFSEPSPAEEKKRYGMHKGLPTNRTVTIQCEAVTGEDRYFYIGVYWHELGHSLETLFFNEFLNPTHYEYNRSLGNSMMDKLERQNFKGMPLYVHNFERMTIDENGEGLELEVIEYYATISEYIARTFELMYHKSRGLQTNDLVLSFQEAFLTDIEYEIVREYLPQFLLPTGKPLLIR